MTNKILIRSKKNSKERIAYLYYIKLYILVTALMAG